MGTRERAARRSRHRATRASALILAPAVLVLGLALASRLQAFPDHARKTQRACVTCHTHPAGGAELTEGGKTFLSKKKVPAESEARRAEYVGSARCQSCHLREHQSWSATAHASALARLAAADTGAVAAMAAKLKVKLKAPPAKTDACVVCHVTGMGLPGGYPGADSAANASLAAVGCESCHGPGSLHVSAPFSMKKTVIQRAPSAKLCTQCHTAIISPGFDYAALRMKGAHPNRED
ncbi:MAG TPA: multiheme c-type cytochrome [Candidatus Eisenbacteria bacterium]|nr:multiheme c-type cytochrome [Candidatus Eisenbacteria bacterium]